MHCAARRAPGSFTRFAYGSGASPGGLTISALSRSVGYEPSVFSRDELTYVSLTECGSTAMACTNGASPSL